MFKSVGSNIKSIALIIWVLEVLATAVVGLAFIFGENNLLLGLLFLLAGPLVAWLSVALLYAFGQLVENSDKVVHYMEAQHCATADKRAATASSSKEFADILSKLTYEQIQQRLNDPTCSDQLKALYRNELARRASL